MKNTAMHRCSYLVPLHASVPTYGHETAAKRDFLPVMTFYLHSTPPKKGTGVLLAEDCQKKITNREIWPVCFGAIFHPPEKVAPVPCNMVFLQKPSDK